MPLLLLDDVECASLARCRTHFLHIGFAVRFGVKLVGDNSNPLGLFGSGLAENAGDRERIRHVATCQPQTREYVSIERWRSAPRSARASAVQQRNFSFPYFVLLAG